MKVKSTLILSIFLLVLCSCSKDSDKSQSINSNIIWQKAIGSFNGNYDQVDYLIEIANTLDNNYIISSYSYGGGGDKSEVSSQMSDYWIIKINRDGNVIWENTIGGELDDTNPSIIANSDHGYIVFGTSRSFQSKDKSEDSRGQSDYWVVKLNAEGNIVWDKTIGGSGTEQAGKVIENSEGYLLIGTSNSPISGDKTLAPYNLGNYDLWIVQIDFDGNKLWEKIIGGLGDEQVSKVIKTSDGGYFIGVNAKNSSSSIDKSENSLGLMDCWLIKLDASSNIVWENTFGGLADDSIGDIKILPNGNLLVAATSNSDKSTDKSEDIKGDSDIWLLMLDASGDIMWDKTIGGSLEDGGLQLARTSNGRNFLTGFSTSNTSGDKIFNNNDRFPDCWLIEFNDLGEIINQFVIGGNGRDMPKALHYNQNGNLFIGMQSTSLNNTGDKKLTQDVSYVGNFWLMEWDIQ